MNRLSYGFLLIGLGHETEQHIRKADAAAVFGPQEEDARLGPKRGGASWPYSANPGS
jgi:hypothetical protein